MHDLYGWSCIEQLAQLRPVLVELGATLPTRGLYVLESQLPELDAVVTAWLVEAAPRLRSALAPREGS